MLKLRLDIEDGDHGLPVDVEPPVERGVAVVEFDDEEPGLVAGLRATFED